MTDPIKELVEALEPFTDVADSYTSHHGDDMALYLPWVTLGHLRRLRTALLAHSQPPTEGLGGPTEHAEGE